MKRPNVLAFLLCENASKDRDGKVSLQSIFDRILMPRTPKSQKNFFVYYKMVVSEPCAVALRITHLVHSEISELNNWRESFSQPGLVQGVFRLSTGRFVPGSYEFELVQVNGGSQPISLATMRFVVDQQEE